jgi:hypothetical protein
MQLLIARETAGGAKSGKYYAKDMSSDVEMRTNQTNASLCSISQKTTTQS